MRTVSLKLTMTEYALVLELAGRGSFRSISDVLRQGLQLVCQSFKVKPSVVNQAIVERMDHEPRHRKQPLLAGMTTTRASKLTDLGELNNPSKDVTDRGKNDRRKKRR